MKVKAARALRWRTTAAAVCAAAAGMGTVLATGSSVAASNTSDPAVNAYVLAPPGSNDANQATVNDLITGPDGALWFTWNVNEGAYGLGRVTTAGDVSTFPVPSGWYVTHVASGDGSLWVIEGHDGGQFIGQWSTAGKLIREFPITSGFGAGITWGLDGAVWFVGSTSGDPAGDKGGSINRMTTSGVITTYPLPPARGGYNAANDIAVGSDGNLWFDLPSQGAIGRMSLTGAVDEFPLPGSEHGPPDLSDQDLALGPDGAMWVGVFWSGGIQRVTTGGVATTVAAQSSLASITWGSDGNLWFVTAMTGEAGEMSPDGTITAIHQLPSSIPAGDPVITTGPDGKLWIGAQGAIEQLDPKLAVPSPAPSASSGAGGGASMPTPTPFSLAVPTSTPPTARANPVAPVVVQATPSDAPAGPVARAVAARTPLSNGSNVALVVGSLLAVVLAAAAVRFVIRRRRGARSRV